MRRETDAWPFVRARWYGPNSSLRAVTHIVIHDMEYSRTLRAAEDVAKYFQEMPDGRKASAHVCVDADSVVQCVKDNDVAFAAPGLNGHGIHIELAGYQRQTREQWLDPYGLRLLENGADVAAQYCMKYDIPTVHVTDTELADGKRGLVGHDQVSRVFKQSDHTDPGKNFPWDYFMERVGALYNVYAKEVSG